MLTITSELEPKAEIITKELLDMLEPAIVHAHEDTLRGIEDLQIKLYSAAGNPRQPSGSTYRRTFNLRNSSFTQINHRKLPVITSVWEARAGYAKYVMGLITDQASIHRNRWKSLEEIAQGAELLHKEFLDRRIENEVRF